MLKRIPIRLKLVLLAGVPVIGALILAVMVAREARHEAESAAAIGSIEDLAHLSGQMARLVHALQFERHDLALRHAQKALSAPALQERFAQTDAARQQLDQSLAGHRVASLPPRLARDLKAARARLGGLQQLRGTALSGEQPIDVLLDYYQATNLSLISATAALSQLVEDSELLRAISALVIVLEIKERASQEHALLSHVFTINEFPAGTFKELVTLTTEEAVYMNMLNVEATDSVNQRFQQLSQGPALKRANELREVALETVNDEFHVSPQEWSTVQGTRIERLRDLEVALTEAVRSAAVAKISAADRSVRLSYGLTASVILVSALLAAFVARGISRSVASLARAAEQVSEKKDFGIRAVKTSEDELGRLTDTWNDMLAGIQARDAKLRQHQDELEQLVALRTAALETRNQAMRLVLDNVEQGLATINLDGTLAPERSRVFDDWFGEVDGQQASFADQLAGEDEDIRASLQLAWEQVADGELPLECAIDQILRHIQVKGRHYDLRYKPILDGEELRGVLLVVSDVTSEMERVRRDADQRELIAVFERFVRDRAGFNEFFHEAEALVAQVIGADSANTQLTLRALHTLKGNCSLFGVASVVTVAHELETSMIDAASPLLPEQVAQLTRVWQGFAARVGRLSGAQAEQTLQLAHEELGELEAAVAARTPHVALALMLARLRHERGVVRLRRLAEQAKSVAQRLGKGDLEVRIQASSDVRFETERWSAFWAAFVHVVRNAVDHGIELPSERRAAGKPERPKLELSASVDRHALTIEISDDGRGIDWARVREKAAQRGLPSETEGDLLAALFVDGLSTAESVTELSGRGVGLSAVQSAASALGGVVAVTSTRGQGTTVSFRFPLVDAIKANGPPSRATA